jgi:hypothetical protein
LQKNANPAFEGIALWLPETSKAIGSILTINYAETDASACRNGGIAMERHPNT